MKWTKGEFWITDDNSAADIDYITESLSATYWAAGRSREIVKKSVCNSVMLSMFEKDKSIGFARLVTDYATFVWLCDFVVDPAYRGRALGKWLMECILEHPVTHVRINLLATKDAHGLYEKYGYKPKECMILLDHRG